MTEFKDGDKVRIKGTKFEGEILKVHNAHGIYYDVLFGRPHDMVSALSGTMLEKVKPEFKKILNHGDLLTAETGSVYVIDDIDSWRSADERFYIKVERPTGLEVIWERDN